MLSMLNKNFIINLLLEIAFVEISLLFFQNILKIKISKRNNIFYILISSICFSLGFLIGKYIFASIFTVVGLIAFSFLVLKIDILDIASYTSLNSIILLNISFLVFKLISIITNYNSDFEILTLPIFGIISLVLFSITEFMIYFVIKKLDIDSLFIASINAKAKIITVISTIDLLLVFAVFSNFFEMFANNILYIVLLDTYFAFSISVIIHLCYKLYINTTIENLKLCNNTVLHLCDTTRAFKHDFHNIIQALGGYIWTNNLEGLKQYYNDVLTDCQNTNNLSKLNPELINNPAIYSILVDKYNKASENNITINLEVLLDLNSLKMKTYEFTRILGILLDNAIEASQECSKKNINISFKQDKSKQLLIVENTYTNKDLSIDKIFEKDFTTKPHNTGLGLWEVRKILNKYSNLNLYTTKNNDYFSQQLEIFSA